MVNPCVCVCEGVCRVCMCKDVCVCAGMGLWRGLEYHYYYSIINFKIKYAFYMLSILPPAHIYFRMLYGIEMYRKLDLPLSLGAYIINGRPPQKYY